MSNRNKQPKVKKEIIQGKEAYIARLKNGETISFRGKGNSMTPLIKSGEKCEYSPVKSIEDIKIGDAVFCKVGKFIFTHLVTAIKNDEVQISNNRGYVNGWTHISNVYGKVVKIGI